MFIGQIGAIAGSQTALTLDLYPSSIAAYSTRRLSKTYGGNAIRVRRSNDNAETDIGFSGNNLNETVLLEFAGSNNVFVKTWYDQSGRNLHLSSNSVSNQPIIKLNNKPAIQFIASAATVFISSTAINWSGFTPDIYQVIRIDNYSSSGSLYVANTGSVGWYQTQGTTAVQGGGVFDTIYQNDSTVKLINFFVNTGNEKSITFGSLTAFTSVEVPNVFPTTTSLLIGKDNAGNTLNLDGYMQELIIYSGNQSTNKTNIKSNINSYFSLDGSAATILPYSQIWGTEGGDSFNMFFPKAWYEPPSLTTATNEFYVYGEEDILPFCDVIGSSGGPYLIFANSNGGAQSTDFAAISTAGKTNITININQYRQTGAPTSVLYWSVDRVTWNSTAFNNVTDDNAWHACTPKVLPVGCNNQPILYLRLEITSDSSGIFTGFDDLLITGT